MNYLNIRSKVKMNFVIGEHRDAFEKHVIDLYCESEGGFWGTVPSLEANIVSEISPKFVLAGLLGYASGDKSFYMKETVGKVLPEFEEIWATANLNEFQTEAPGNVMHALGSIEVDAQAVLDHHRMLHMFLVGGDLSQGGTGQQALRHMPLLQVW